MEDITENKIECETENQIENETENQIENKTENKRNIRRRKLVKLGIIITIIIAVYCYFDNRVDYDKLEYVQIKYVGTMVPTGGSYTLSKQQGKWFASYEEIEWLERSVSTTKAVSDAYADEIIKTLNKSKAHRWDKFNLKYEFRKSLQAIETDGVYYSFYMKFSDGRVINIREYNIYPEEYMTVYRKFESKWENNEMNN